MAVGIINKNAKVQVCVTPQTGDLTEAQFKALTWIDVCCPMAVPDVTEAANFLSQFCISGEENTAVGTQTGSEFDLQFLYKSACVGQDTLRAVQGTQTSLALKIERADGSATQTPTTLFMQVQVGGWTYGGGDPDSFVADTASLKISQKPIFVKPAPIP